MNKKQKCALTCGIIVLSAVLLFPPLVDLSEKSVGIIFVDFGNVDFAQLNFHNLVVAAISAAFIYGLRNKKKPSDAAQEDGQEQQ